MSLGAGMDSDGLCDNTFGLAFLVRAARVLTHNACFFRSWIPDRFICLRWNHVGLGNGVHLCRLVTDSGHSRLGYFWRRRPSYRDVGGFDAWGLGRFGRWGNSGGSHLWMSDISSMAGAEG